MRRTIMRYVNLSLVLTFRLICPSVKKRFPTLSSLVDAGIMLPNELEVFVEMDAKSVHPKYWMPCVWATIIATRARREGRIRDDFSYKTITDEINRFRGGCLNLMSYDWISIPLVYTQVVTLAVYSYFLAALMGTQFLDPKKDYSGHAIDLYVPVFALLQFFFYMGWLIVAESLVNPFGDNDDDIEVNWLIDRNLQISYIIVDEVHEEHPKLLKDPYWDDIFPSELPYSGASKQRQNEPFLGSTKDIQVHSSRGGKSNVGVNKHDEKEKKVSNTTRNQTFLAWSRETIPKKPFRDKGSKSILRTIRERILPSKNKFSSDLQDTYDSLKLSTREQSTTISFEGDVPEKEEAICKKKFTDKSKREICPAPHSWHGMDSIKGPFINEKTVFENLLQVNRDSNEVRDSSDFMRFEYENFTKDNQELDLQLRNAKIESMKAAVVGSQYLSKANLNINKEVFKNKIATEDSYKRVSDPVLNNLDHKDTDEMKSEMSEWYKYYKERGNEAMTTENAFIKKVKIMAEGEGVTTTFKEEKQSVDENKLGLPATVSEEILNHGILKDSHCETSLELLGIGGGRTRNSSQVKYMQTIFEEQCSDFANLEQEKKKM